MDFGIVDIKEMQMRKKNVKWKQRKEPPSLPKWLKSYHLLLFALIMMMIFGAIMKQISEVQF